jgi:hypothetical protein
LNQWIFFGLLVVSPLKNSFSINDLDCSQNRSLSRNPFNPVNSLRFNHQLAFFMVVEGCWFSDFSLSQCHFRIQPVYFLPMIT